MIDFIFAEKMMDKIGFNESQTRFFKNAYTRITGDTKTECLLNKICELLFDMKDEYQDTLLSLCSSLAAESGFHEYSITLFVCLCAAEELKKKFDRMNISEDIFFDSVKDFHTKLEECITLHGIYGSFVGKWLFAFFKGERFALGRMQYETRIWMRENVILNDNTLKTGDKYIAFHIPSDGRPFDRKTRCDSYKKAVSFFKNDFKNKPIPFVCASYLLDPENKKYLPEKSNIVDFANDFDIIIPKSPEDFKNGWRIFGASYLLPPEKLEEKTSLQKAYKRRLMEKSPFCNGIGIFFAKTE